MCISQIYSSVPDTKMNASRKSVRTRSASGTPTTPAEKRLKLRSVTKSPATPITITPAAGDSEGVRRSTRKRIEKTPLPVVMISQESSEDASPSPVASTSRATTKKASQSKKTPLKKRARQSVKNATTRVRNSLKDDNVDDVEEGTNQSAKGVRKPETPNTRRRSERPVKPTARYNAIEESSSPSSMETTPVNKKKAPKKRTETKSDAKGTTPTPRLRTRIKSLKEAESPAPSTSRRRGETKVASVGTDETPRSSRRNPVKTPANATSDTPSKSAASSQSGEIIQGKKLEWKFNVYGIPKCPLPCRESQFEEIWKFLFENITEKASGCMYVSGVPGTGKTVIVQAVVDTMKKVNDENKKNLSFKFLYINGLTLASPDKIWKRMFKGLELTSKTKSVSTKEALKRLDSYFESHQRIPVVLVVDELDQILDKQQSILYQLLEWSSHAKNMFSFIAIFNTMSLPEHGLAMRNYSRMGFKRAVFPPYNFEQLHKIVSNMLGTFKTARLNSESVSLLSRKVAPISGG
ncbi:Origin recognition complex subunit 1 [Orchesella cincta]|uniref:Origin recognition complex subunit 1 n=1 Tax=Orchesella cincta TaxID=48709 RepID=A0A1D2NHA5_ORCCI|nr:Origin recognition complex subunit 1 [Orchesella cincta]